MTGVRFKMPMVRACLWDFPQLHHLVKMEFYTAFEDYDSVQVSNNGWCQDIIYFTCHTCPI